MSNNCTYGYKWKMIGIYALAGLPICIVISILNSICAASEHDVVIVLMTFLMILISLFWIFVCIGLQANIYKQLTEDI